jgi:hypothetical protein
MIARDYTYTGITYTGNAINTAGSTAAGYTWSTPITTSPVTWPITTSPNTTITWPTYPNYYPNYYNPATIPVGSYPFYTSDLCISFLKQYGILALANTREKKKGFYQAKFGDADIKMTFFGGKFELHDNIIDGPAFKNEIETQYFLYGLPIFPLQKQKIQEIIKQRKLDATHAL